MKKMKTYFASLVCLCLLLGILSSCTKEIGGDDSEIVTPPDIDENTELEAVTIRIGAAETAETKAMHGDKNAVEGEFIHSLHLFIVDNSADTIAKHITVTPDSEDLTPEQRAEAEDGNLPQYSTTIDILPGKYTFYAFANMEKAKTETEDTSVDELLSGKTEGSTWTGIDNLIINNPAASVNLAAGQYIPMSVKQENVNLTVDGQRVSLSLVRLVSKMKVSLHNTQGGPIQITKLEMSGSYAKSVSLFKPDNISIEPETTELIYTEDFTDVTVANDQSYDFPEFYINETKNSQFTLKLTIDDQVYNGPLSKVTIERNHVRPVLLNLKNNNLQLVITADVAPIGGYPITVYSDPLSLTDIQKVILPEGCTFRIGGAFVQETVIRKVTNWTWTVPQASFDKIRVLGFENVASDENLSVVENTDEDGSISRSYTQKLPDSAASADTLSFEGALTSLEGQTVQLELLVSQPNPFSQTLEITTEKLGDYNTRSLTQWGEAPRWYEAVGLVKRPSAPGFNPEP